MKILRITVLGAALVLAAAPMAQGQAGQQAGQQEGGARSRGRGRSMQALFNGITLSADQKAQVDSIEQAYRAKMPAMTRGQRPDAEAMQSRRELATKERADLRAVLTPDQQTIFDKNAESMRQRGRRGDGSRGA
jgi:Spy/CpxP family protein refolding chaperone